MIHYVEMPVFSSQLEFKLANKTVTTNFVECVVMFAFVCYLSIRLFTIFYLGGKTKVNASFILLPHSSPARSTMHSGVLKTTLNRNVTNVHSCLQNHKSTSQHFVGALRFPLYKMPNAKCRTSFPIENCSSGQHVPFCRDNVQEDSKDAYSKK